MPPTVDTPTLDIKERPEGAHPMRGGDDQISYTQNSCYQRGVIDAAKTVIIGAVTEKLDLENNITIFDPAKPFTIADFGCATGPNTFLAMQNILEAVQQKHKSLQKTQPEFQVFFNDHGNNDFNILFRSLPQNKDYFAAGVPGSFHARVFPKASLHFAHCSYSLQWLSQVPKEVQDKNSPAYNKGQIHYTHTDKHVAKAYSDQFHKDVDSFLKARAQEIVAGGLMVILLPGLPRGEILLVSTSGACMLHYLLGSSLMELVNLGVTSEESVDSFNLPLYHASVEELEMLIEINNSFTLEKIGSLDHPMKDMPFDVQSTSLQMRALTDGVFSAHFGKKIMDQLFEIYTMKLQENYHAFDKEVRRDVDLFLVLKRKSN